jgi:uncharacterized protein YyaL (SSP411 family)
MPHPHSPANRLAQATSPYLLQHAHNPVDWFPWGEEALQKARAEDKPILVSIGYSACHWCHVMERESFEDQEIAALMNRHFVCIKVDREERPDVDQIYMDAVQAMGLNGGWPLNVFLLPDTRPFYGGTYFRPDQWGYLLQQIDLAYRQSRNKLEESAEQFTRVLNRSEARQYGLQLALPEAHDWFTVAKADEIFATLAQQFDSERGGMGRPPKFPMPSIYLFLLRLHHHTGQARALQHVQLTLNRMANGGIYDQIGGGFARYSVDGDWFAPHFEKMLYDNGQLVSLYAEAFAATGDPLYRDVVSQTVDFVARELTSPEGGFYAALDADSEGEEGLFYTWTNEELNEVLRADAPLAKAYYNCQAGGNWEHGRNILHREMPDHVFAQTAGLPLADLRAKVADWQARLLRARAGRVRPGLDDKVLSGWNGLMLKGLADAYAALGEPRFLALAQANATFLYQNMWADGQLYRNYKNGVANIPGYLEDYALVAQGLLALYQVGFDERWLRWAQELVDQALARFYDPTEHLFFFTANDAEPLIARKKELFDNVISSSNSVMANNLYWLGHLVEAPGQPRYRPLALQMLHQVLPLLAKDARYLSNWGCLYTTQLSATVEVAVVGEGCQALAQALHQPYLPNKVVLATATASELPLLAHRPAKPGETWAYVCRDHACRLPVREAGAALALMRTP